MDNYYLAKTNPQETIAEHTDKLLDQYFKLKKIYGHCESPYLNWEVLRLACLLQMGVRENTHEFGIWMTTQIVEASLDIDFDYLYTELSEVNGLFQRMGRNIRDARKSKKLTIEMLSESIGISESFLGTVERGESSLSTETLIGVCRALGVSSDSLIMSRARQNTDLSGKKDVLLTILNNASDAELEFLIDYIKFYRGKITF